MSAPASPPAPRHADPVPDLIQRLVAASGIAFAILFVLAVLLSGGDAPETDAPVGEWSQWARDNEPNARISALLMGLGVYTFVLFLGALRHAIAEAERRTRGFARGADIVLIGGALGVAGLAIGIFINTGSVLEPDTPPETIRALSHIAGAGFGLAAPALAAMLVTVGLLNPSIRALPAWLGWVALAGGVASILQLGILLSENLDNVFGIFYPIGFLLLVIFSVGASVALLRRPAGGRADAAPPPARG
jgi:hypothetical protein